MQRLFVAPSDALIDQPLAVQVEGLAPGEQALISATLRTWNGRLWRSSALFEAGPGGSVDLARDAPLSGTWSGASAAGLLWSMRRCDGDEAEAHRASVLAPRELRVEATARSGAAAAAVIRRLASPGVGRELVDDDGLSGALYLPPGGAAGAAVIVLGGSSGEPDYAHAALLASRGFAALALAYFRAPGLPPWLLGVPVERVGQAASWLRRRTGARLVACWGTSRGAELALLAASLVGGLDAVVSIAGTGVLVGGFGPPDLHRACEGSAWSFQGRPLPSLERDNPLAVSSLGVPDPVAEAPLIEAALAHAPSVEAASIAVERVPGPVLLLAGGDDLCWPSARLLGVAHERLARAGRAGALQVYPGAGHFLGTPGLPTTTDRYQHPLTRREYLAGGNPRADADACADLWPRALGFLERAAAGELRPARPTSRAGRRRRRRRRACRPSLRRPRLRCRRDRCRPRRRRRRRRPRRRCRRRCQPSLRRSSLRCRRSYCPPRRTSLRRRWRRWRRSCRRWCLLCPPSLPSGCRRRCRRRRSRRGLRRRQRRRRARAGTTSPGRRASRPGRRSPRRRRGTRPRRPGHDADKTGKRQAMEPSAILLSAKVIDRLAGVNAAISPDAKEKHRATRCARVR